MENKRILIVGATGSLGTSLVQKWLRSSNQILNISRDEEKQWRLKTNMASSNLHQVIGDICMYDCLKDKVYAFDPHYIIYTAALKHIDVCEKQPDQSIRMNFQGVFQMIQDIQIHKDKYKALDCFVFVSTDKACIPVTVYGQSKAISEKLIQNSKVEGVRFLCVRYGNVLNSRGSILPLLHQIGKDSSKCEFFLTDPNMTRFIMRLDESVNIIEYAINLGKNGEIIIPHLKACRIPDMIEIFSDLYKKPIRHTGVRCVEKYHEDLLSIHESSFTYKLNNIYIHISNIQQPLSSNVIPFSSKDTLIDKDELYQYLKKYNYL
jgi:UDP-N-acetylglucosamine 4,6-dehydratase/5-epimerase